MGENSGHVRIYKRNGTPWDQLGTDIDGEAAHDYLAIEHGPAITMNAGGTIGDSVDLSFPVRQHSHAGCLVALGPVLRQRQTYDGCFERRLWPQASQTAHHPGPPRPRKCRASHRTCRP